jgi:hypothetical protein
VRVKLLDRGPTGPWSEALDVTVGDCVEVIDRPLVLSETSVLELRIAPVGGGPFKARAYIGDVLVASTEPADRADHALEDAVDDAGRVHYRCRKQLLRDWVGQTVLRVEADRGRAGPMPCA